MDYKSDLANPWIRILASIVDGGILFVCILTSIVTFFIPLLALIGLSIYLYIWRGQTPAMYLFKLRVVSVNTGEQASPLTMLLRSLTVNVISYAIGWTGFGLILWAACVAPMFFSENRQEAWDFVVSTTVVNDPNEQYRRSPESKEKSATQALSDDLDLEF